MEKFTLEAIKSFLINLENEGIISNLNLTYNLTLLPKEGENRETKFNAAFQTLSTSLLTVKEENQIILKSNLNIIPTPDPKLVQICVSRKEINRRIDAFVKRKRKEVDDTNVQEFCGRTTIDENHPDYENVNTCARVDAIFFPRYSEKSHVKLSRVENKWGPQTKPKTNLHNEPLPSANSFSKQLINNAIEERLRNMESHLKLKSGTTTQNLYGRLKILEDKILYLEGISPDYFGTSLNKIVSQKQKPRLEFENKFKDWSVKDIDNRLEQLSQIIKEKSKKP